MGCAAGGVAVAVVLCGISIQASGCRTSGAGGWDAGRAIDERSKDDWRHGAVCAHGGS
jgi:hypothetical protein